jgi:hypothetical protein
LHLQWFILSQGKRSGPYDIEELGRMLENDKITLDTVIIREGCPVGRRLFSSPELFFPDLIAQSASAKQRDAHVNLHGATRIARFQEPNTGQSKPYKPLAPQKAAPLLKPSETENTVGIEIPPPLEITQKKGKRKKAAKNPPQKPEALPLKVQPSQAQAQSQAQGQPQAPSQPKSKDGNPGSRNPSPAHQLPKAASEGQLKPRGDFTWARNRVNPTAPRSIFHSREKIGLGKRKTPQNKMPPEILYIAVGLVSIISIMLIAFVASNKNQKPEPRLILRKSQPAQVETARPNPPAEMVFETGPKIPVNTDSKVQKTPSAPDQPKNSAARDNTTKQKPKSPAGESKLKKQDSPSKPVTAKTPKATTIAKAPKKPNAENPSPAFITNDAGLKSNLFKKVTINSVQLLISPDTCEPCQIPGKLQDGTRILLTSSNIQPWRAVQKKGSFNVKAHGFLTKNSQGTYSLIVQRLDP